MRISISSDDIKNKIENFISLIDGNYYHKYKLYDLYKNYNYKFIEKISGEHSIIIVDKFRNRLYAYTDIFGTKPLYFGFKDKKFKVTSFRYDLNGYNGIKRIPNSSILKLDTYDHSFTIEKHSKFDTTEKYNTFERCIDALKNAIDIRCEDNIGSAFSAGHDTGAILQRINENNTKCNFYYFNTNKEDSDIIKARQQKCNLTELNYIVNSNVHIKCQLAKIKDKPIDVDYNKDLDLTSLLISIFEKAKDDNIKNFITGLGGDEVLKNNTTYPDIDKDLKTHISERDDFLIGEYPGNNSEQGQEGRFWIDIEESISNIYGINLRYPFLDKHFIQEFLNLTYKAKNYCYKSVTQIYLKRTNMPFMLRKSGFSSIKS